MADRSRRGVRSGRLRHGWEVVLGEWRVKLPQPGRDQRVLADDGRIDSTAGAPADALALPSGAKAQAARPGFRRCGNLPHAFSQIGLVTALVVHGHSDGVRR